MVHKKQLDVKENAATPAGKLGKYYFAGKCGLTPQETKGRLAIARPSRLLQTKD